MKLLQSTLCILTGFLMTGSITNSSTQPFKPVTGLKEYTPSHVLTKPTSAEPVSLETALSIARTNNPSLAAVRLAIIKARATEAQMQALSRPNLDLIGSAGRYSDGQRVSPASANGQAGVYSKNIVGAELVLSYPLYTGGTLSANEDAARFTTKARQRQLRRAECELDFHVARVFAQILAQQERITSLEFNQKSLNNHLKRINELIDAQKAAVIDRLRVEVRIADLQQSVTRAGNDLKLAMQALANLMGLDTAEFVIAGELTPPTGTENSPGLPTLLKQSVSLRNDFSAMAEQLKAQAKRVDAEKGGTKPKVSLFGAYGNRWGINPDDDPANAGEDDYAGRVGLSLTLPIWDGRLRKARIKAETAELASMQKQYSALKQRIELEVRTAVLNLQSARKRAAATGKTVEQASEVLRIQQETQGLGKATLTDVLDAQSALLTAQTNNYAAMAECKIAEAELRLAVGGKATDTKE